MSARTKTKPQAYQLTYDQLAPDMKRYVGVWVVPEGADNPFADKIEEIRQQQLAEDRRMAARKTKVPRARKAVAA